MLRFLHTLTAVLFYFLGSGFFIAYVLLRNGIGGDWPLTWLETADLPLLLVSVLYGGTSVIRSFQGDAPVSKILILGITLPLFVLFSVAAYLTFYPM